MSIGKRDVEKIKVLLTARRILIEMRKGSAKRCIWSMDLYDNFIWPLEDFKMWLWRVMIKVKWTDRVRNDEVLRKKTVESNKKKKLIWVGHILH